MPTTTACSEKPPGLHRHEGRSGWYRDCCDEIAVLGHTPDCHTPEADAWRARVAEIPR